MYSLHSKGRMMNSITHEIGTKTRFKGDKTTLRKRNKLALNIKFLQL